MTCPELVEWVEIQYPNHELLFSNRANIWVMDVLFMDLFCSFDVVIGPSARIVLFQSSLVLLAAKDAVRSYTGKSVD